jgi:hypothetical protein
LAELIDSGLAGIEGGTTSGGITIKTNKTFPRTTPHLNRFLHPPPVTPTSQPSVAPPLFKVPTFPDLDSFDDKESPAAPNQDTDKMHIEMIHDGEGCWPS